MHTSGRWVKQVFIVAAVLGLLTSARPSVAQGMMQQFLGQSIHLQNADTDNNSFLRSQDPVARTRFIVGDIPTHYDLVRLKEKAAQHPLPQASTAANSAVVYQSYRDSNWEIYSQIYGGENRLTYDAAADVRPRLSWDSAKIAFSSNRDGDYEIFTMNYDGSNIRQLTFNSTSDTAPYWSPDGTRLAFSSYRDGNWEIYTMNADGTNQTRFTFDATHDDLTPAWSPDGTQIAWNKYADSHGLLYLMNANGSNQHAISLGGKYFGNPIWSPDGLRILYDVDDYGDDQWNMWNELWVYDLSIGGYYEYLVGEYLADKWAGAWSPENDTAMYTYVQYVVANHQLYIGSSYIDVRYGSRWTWSGTDMLPDWQVDRALPISRLTALPDISAPTGFSVTWSGTDVGPAGLASYDIQYRDGLNGMWTNWLVNTTTTSDIFYGTAGHTYYFRSRARDYANNLEAYPNSDGDASTIVYQYAVTGQILGNREQPVAVASVVADPAALNTGLSRHDGRFDLYFAAGGSYTLTVSRDDFGALPSLLNVTVPLSTSLPTLYLPPLDDQISDGQFESGLLSTWIPMGDLTPTITSTAHTGNYAALLGGIVPSDTVSSDHYLSTIEQTITTPLALTDGTLSLLYKVEAADPLSDTLTAYIIGANGTVTFTLPVTATDWTHSWFDVSIWTAPTATLRIELATPDKARTVGVLVDEVTWGSSVIGSHPIYLPIMSR